jgi:hypothetical protein
MLVRLAPVALAAGALMLVGCGSNGPSPEDEARAAVADFLAAYGEQNADAACSELTDSAQDEVSSVVARITERQPSDCPEAMTALFERVESEGTNTGPIIDLADQIRSDALERGSVSVSVSGDTGTVTLARGGREESVPVAEVDRDWLVADAHPLLFEVDR